MPSLASPVLLLLFSASSTFPVDVGRFEPSRFPNLIQMERRLPHAEMTSRVEKIFSQGKCRMPGQSKRRFDVTVSYAVLVDHQGSAKKVVVGDVGCAALEVLVGQVVVAQAERGDFRPQHQEGERWYASDLNFSLGEPEVASSIADKDKVICTRSEPELGSRLKFTRMCKTAAEWQAFEADRQQLRRDLGDAARCSGHSSCTSD